MSNLSLRSSKAQNMNKLVNQQKINQQQSWLQTHPKSQLWNRKLFHAVASCMNTKKKKFAVFSVTFFVHRINLSKKKKKNAQAGWIYGDGVTP